MSCLSSNVYTAHLILFKQGLWMELNCFAVALSALSTSESKRWDITSKDWLYFALIHSTMSAVLLQPENWCITYSDLCMHEPVSASLMLVLACNPVWAIMLRCIVWKQSSSCHHKLIQKLNFMLSRHAWAHVTWVGAAHQNDLECALWKALV